MKFGMSGQGAMPDGMMLSDFGLRVRSACNRERGAQKYCFWLFSASPCILKGQSIKNIMVSIKFWIVPEIFIHIGP